MLCVISPAKTLDFESPLATKRFTTPRLVAEAAELVDVMRSKSPGDIRSLMRVSEEIATLNAARFRDFDPEHTPANSRPAVLAFAGDVYQGLSASTFAARDFTEAQKSLRILSGLYGLLRPLDLIQPHRLEMGTRLVTERGHHLTHWWGGRITDLLAADVDSSPGAKVLVNLASNEYFSAIDANRLGVRIVTPRFEDRDGDGVPRVVSFHAKRARGTMAAWLIHNRVRSAAAITGFAAAGYTFDPERSTKNTPVFVR